MPRNTKSGIRTIHGITLDRDSDGSYAVTMPDRWFSASPANDAEDNLEGELCMLLDHLWSAAPTGAAAQPAVQEPVAEVRSKFGDPEAFGERELVIDEARLQTLPYGTKLYTHAAPSQASGAAGSDADGVRLRCAENTEPCPVCVEAGRCAVEVQRAERARTRGVREGGDG